MPKKDTRLDRSLPREALTKLLAIGADLPDSTHHSPGAIRSRLVEKLLSAPLGRPGSCEQSLQAVADQSSGGPRIMGNVLLEGDAPLETLKEIKELAKRSAGEDVGAAERDAYFLLYLCAIASACRFHGRWITSHDPARLAARFSKQAEEPWVFQHLRNHLLAASQACLELADRGEPAEPLRGDPRGEVACEAEVGPEGPAEELLYSRTDRPESLTEEGVVRLNRLGQRMAGVSQIEDLYPEVCRSMRVGRDDWVAVIHLKSSGEAGAPEARLLASSGRAAEEGPPRLSRTVLRHVMQRRRTTVARTRPQRPDHLQLTITEGAPPRIVAAAPLENAPDVLEVIYLETPDVGRGRPLVESLDFLEAAARLVRLARSNLLAAEQRARFRARERELEMAAEIQQALLPDDLDCLDGVEAALRYQPARGVGGDYCDVWACPDGRLALALADVSGKGMPAALVMAGLHAALRTITAVEDAPEVVVEQLNRYICRHTPEGTLVTLIMGFYDPRVGGLEWVNAGHEPPVLLSPDGEASRLDESADLLLGLEGPGFRRQKLEITPGGELIVVTDGISEAGTDHRRMFSAEGVMSAALAAPGGSAGNTAEAVYAAAERFAPGGFHDDATVLVLRRPISGSSPTAT